MATPSNPLPSWNETATREAITGFVESITQEGSPTYVPPEERIATFDNDGTLWCEKPMPIQLDFIMRNFCVQADQDAALHERQPWKAAYEKDMRWIGSAIVKHYHGDESDVKIFIGALQEGFGGMNVEHYEELSAQFLKNGIHPTLQRPYSACGYKPMVELLRYLETNGFSTYIASGGDRDFMRPIVGPLYGIPPERVIGTTFGLTYTEDEKGGNVLYKPQMDVFDDGPVKPVRIWSRIGRRPLVAGGNSNGDIPMFRYAKTATRNPLRLLLLHDDAEREFDYVAGAEESLKMAQEEGWTVISIKKDWNTVFAG